MKKNLYKKALFLVFIVLFVGSIVVLSFRANGEFSLDIDFEGGSLGSQNITEDGVHVYRISGNCYIDDDFTRSGNRSWRSDINTGATNITLEYSSNGFGIWFFMDRIGGDWIVNYFNDEHVRLAGISMWSHMAGDSKTTYIDNESVGQQWTTDIWNEDRWEYLYIQINASDEAYYCLQSQGSWYNETGFPNNVVENCEISYVRIEHDDVSVWEIWIDDLYSKFDNLENGLVNYWNFEEGSDNVTYDQVGNITGSIYGATWVINDGALGNSLSFDGSDDFITFGDLNTNLSCYNLWVKPNNTITKESGAPTSGSSLLLATFSNDNMFALGNFTDQLDDETIGLHGAAPGNRRTGVQNVNISSDKWHMISLNWNWNLSRYDIYLDGVLQTVVSSPDGHALFMPCTNFAISRNDSVYVGKIDEVRIYNRSLNESEIELLYNQYVPVVSTYDSTGVEETNVTLKGYLNSDGGNPCYTSFEYGTDTNYGNTVGIWGERVDYFDFETEQSGDGLDANDEYIVYTDYIHTECYVHWRSNYTLRNHFDFSAQQSYAWGVALNESNIFMADWTTGHEKVYRYTLDGTYLDSFDVSAQSDNAVGATSDGNNIWIIDLYHDEVYKYTMTGTYVNSFNISSQLTGGRGLGCDDMYIYVGKSGKVWRYLHDGTYVDNKTMERTGEGYGLGVADNYLYESSRGGTPLPAEYGCVILSLKYDSNTAFHYDITGLDEGTLYHFRAIANNSIGTSYGIDKIFLTKPMEPTSFIVTNYSRTKLDLTWTKGLGSNSTYIERNATNVTSWNRGEGILIYNGTGTFTTDTGLNPLTTYYYQAWSYSEWTYNPTVHQWSDDYVSSSNTTLNMSIEDGLVGYWSFDNSSNPGYDDSGTGNNGTVNGATWTSNGTSGGALSFDGDGDFVMTPLNQLGTQTISLWFKVDDIEEGKGTVMSTHIKDDNTGNFAMAIATYNCGVGVVCIDHASNTSWWDPPRLCTGPMYEYNNNNWHHLAFTHDGAGNYELFIDGILKDTYSGSALTDNRPYVMGRHEPTADSYWLDGVLDEIRIYNRSLNESEIELLYNQYLPVVSTFDATGVEENNATLNGFLDYDGGENCTVWFECGKDTTYGYETIISEISSLSDFSYNLLALDTAWENDTGVNAYVAACTENYTKVAHKYNSFSGKPEQVTFYIYRGGLPNGTIYCRVRYVSNDTICAEDTKDASTLLPGDQYYTFVFSDCPIMDNEDIFVSVEYYNATSVDILSFLGHTGGSLWRYPFFSDWYEFPNTLYHQFKYTTLSPGTLYHYRAIANNSIGTSYGDDKAFLTKPYPPTDLIVSNTSVYYELNISWDKGIGSNNTIVERNSSGMTSWSRGEGIEVYNGSGASFDDTGLSDGVTYYYQAWSYSEWTYNPTVHQWSDDYVSSNNTTLNVDIENGLVGYWSFDNTSNPGYDDSGTGNNGTVNGATWIINGKLNGALDFDGVNDYVEVPDDDSLDLTDSFTVVAWFKAYGEPNASCGHLVTRRTPGYQYSLSIYDHNDTGDYCLYSLTETNDGMNTITLFSEPEYIEFNKWYFGVYSYDGINYRLFFGDENDVNEVDNELNSSIAPPSLDFPLFFGQNAYATGNFDGIIDEIRIYNRTLNETEIQYLYDKDVGNQTIYVDDDYNVSTPGWNVTHFNIIQEGINAVAENGTVYVYDGTYYENVFVNNTINLIGENRNTTIIDGSGNGDVVFVSSDFVNITGFMIQNSGGNTNDAGIDIRSNNNIINNNNIASNNYDGIYFYSSSNNTITGNTISNNYFGIWFYSSSNDNNITNNNITSNNQTGILSSQSCNNNIFTSNNILNNDRDGISIRYSSNNNIITGNNITSNNHEGIYLYNSSDNNTITGNNITLNDYNGIIFWSSGNNTIASNNITSNNGDGIYIYSSSDNNTILENNIINNGNGVFIHESSSNNIDNNTVSSNDLSGIAVLAYSNFNNVTNNTIDGLGNYGIRVYQSNNNKINDNNITNRLNGIYLYGGSINNLIYHNTLIDNAENGYDNSINNNWDNGYPSGGNYWDDYSGIDIYHGPNQDISGSDGIGDTPYNISGGSNQDFYPLMGEPIKIVYVDDDYNPSTPGWNTTHFNHIQNGLNAVWFYGNVYVHPGIYYESIIINKTMNLIGEDAATTIIDGGGNPYVILINAPGVTITGFTIRNSASSGFKSLDGGIIVQSQYNNITGNILRYHDHAIYIENTYNNNNISLNTIIYNTVGVEADSSYNNISDNTISANSFGVQLNGLNNNVSQNQIISNTNSGILVSSAQNNISANNILLNKKGISLSSSSSMNNISGNNINLNTQHGVYLSGSSNMVTQNNISSNQISGLELSGSLNNISSNVFSNDGLHVTYSNQNTVVGNTVNGNNLIFQENISNSDVSGAAGQIIIANSYNITVDNYNISGASVAIQLWNSNNCNLSQNNISQNQVGIELSGGSSFNTLEVNNISDNEMFGMQLFNQSNDNVVLANVFADDGLHITDSYNNTVLNNTVNTKLLMYLEDESDVTVDYETGQIITVRCNNLNISHQNISMVDAGIQLWETYNCNISGCNISSCNYGVLLEASASQTNNISGNTFAFNDYGIYDTYSSSSPLSPSKGQTSDNIIINNKIFENNISGIYLTNDEYLIYGNNITENTIGVSLGGSSWNDIIGNNISGNQIGVHVNISSQHNTISGNIINSSNISGTDILGYYNTISGNNISSSNITGINILGYNNNISGNIINSCYVGLNISGYLNDISSNNISLSPVGLNINISGYQNTVQNNNISGCNISGINVIGYGNNILYNNISNCNISALNISGYHNNISGNIIATILFKSVSQIGMEIPGAYNNISGNDISDAEVGIQLLGYLNNISDNNISGNIVGVNISGYNNNISSNNISGSNIYGIQIDGYMNNIYHNNISGNYIGLNISGYHNNISGNNITSPLMKAEPHFGMEIPGAYNNISGNDISDAEVGIQLLGYLNNISDNNISGNIVGVNISGYNNNISSNNISYNSIGLNISGYNNNISGNIIIGNILKSESLYGIWVFGSHNNISENNISRSQFGLGLYGLNNNIYWNNISMNEYGVYSSSSGNLIYRNSFNMNTQQAYDSGSNQWDNGYPTGGNQWGDHIGFDDFCGINQDITGKDGIYDTQNPITGGANIDRYPLVYSYDLTYISSYNLVWNFMSLPFNKSIPKNDLVVLWDNSYYDWGDAVDSDIVLNFIYEWNRSSQNYETMETNQPGYGYWLYNYEECILLAKGIRWLVEDDYITELNVEWNTVGVSFYEFVEKENLTVTLSNGTIYTWQEAVDSNIILGFIYGWNVTNQNYETCDVLLSGRSYWMYAYEECTLTRKN